MGAPNGTVGLERGGRGGRVSGPTCGGKLWVAAVPRGRVESSGGGNDRHFLQCIWDLWEMQGGEGGWREIGGKLRKFGENGSKIGGKLG